MIDAVAAVVAVLVSLVLLGLAALHVYWGVGGRWPGHDGPSLAAIVVGSKPGLSSPGTGPCFVVALGLAAMALGPLFARGLLAAPAPGIVRALTWLSVAVLALRGTVGLFDGRLRPYTVGQPFAHWNRVLYSPLCLALAAGIALTLLAGSGAVLTARPPA